MSLPEKTTAGEYPAFAWPGGYPLAYILADGETLCAACASGKNGSEAVARPGVGLFELRQAGDDPGWAIVGCDVHYEGEPLTYAHCGAQTESAYGVPDAS